MITIGFLANIYDEPFDNSPRNGFLELTRSLEVRLVMIPFADQADRVLGGRFDFLLKNLGVGSLDGLIISGFFSHSMSADGFEAFCRSFEPLPVVTLGVRVPGVSGVVTAIAPGLRGLMGHLLDDHGLTRLAYLGGPRGQVEAEDRRGQVLAELGLRGRSLPEGWEAEGDFSWESGAEAAQELLSRDLPGLQGIVCANDAMAMGALTVLEQHGLRVPDDLVLTGFDDFHAESLTTVRQSSFLQTRAALELVLERIRTGSGPAVREVPSELVVRRSCGCSVAERHTRWTRFWSPVEVTGLEAPFLRSDDDDGLEFHGALARTLVDPNLGPPGDWWPAVERRLAALDSTPGRRLVLDRARFQVAEHIAYLGSRNTGVAFRGVIRLRGLGESLTNAETEADCLAILGHELVAVGIRGCWLSTIEDWDLSDRNLTLRLEVSGGRSRIPDRGTSRFPADQLVPGGCRGLDPSHNLVFVEVLRAKNQTFGLLVLSVAPQDWGLCEWLRPAVATGLQGARLWQDRRNQERRLAETERMAALGGMVAGVAHEVNTPLGVAVTASSDIAGRLEALRHRLAAGSPAAEALDRELAGLEAEASLVTQSLIRAGRLVQNFKEVAVDQSHEESRVFDLGEYLGLVVGSLQTMLRQGGHRTEVSCPPGLTLEGPPGTVAQIVLNLIENGVVHGFGDRRGGTIRVSARAAAEAAELTVADDGVGMDDSLRHRIFEPFFTTRRGKGGSGLGLSIVYNLVTQVWGGTIDCESRPGAGTTFLIRLPAVVRPGT